MTRTASQVAAWAKDQKDRNTGGWHDLCLMFCREAAGASAVYPDAITAWRNAKFKHYGDDTPPRGSFSFWSGGAHGHITVNAGDGDVYSNDIVQSGHIDRVPLTRIHEKWGLKFLGWTEDVDGVHISGFNSPTPQKNDDADVCYVSKLDDTGVKSDSVKLVQKALNKLSFDGGHELVVDGYPGGKTKAEIKLFQDQRCDDDADGKLGPLQTAYLFKLAKMDVTVKK